MTSARVISVNVGRGKDADWAGKLGRTAIDKRAVAGPVEVGRLGLGGDEQVDKPAHGGPEQAVYAYAREDLDWWVEQLGREVTNGLFGENITTAGVDVTGALIGEIWQLGTATVQVTGPRIPCVVFAGWMDERHWVKRFADARRPGAYLRVLREGVVGRRGSGRGGVPPGRAGHDRGVDDRVLRRRRTDVAAAAGRGAGPGLGRDRARRARAGRRGLMSATVARLAGGPARGESRAGRASRR